MARPATLPRAALLALLAVAVSGWAGFARGAGPDPRFTYRIVAKHSGKVLDVFDVQQDDQAPVQQYGWNGGNNQAWRLVPLGDGSFKILAMHSGKVLDVENAAKFNGARVQQFSSHDRDNQRWYLEDAGGGYFFIVSKNSGLVLDVPGAALHDGARLQQFQKNGGDNQKFRFERFLPQDGFRVHLSALRCNKTTEWSADEVYILVVGRRNDGTTVTARLPGNVPHQAAGHWDMNDHGEAHDNQNGDSRKITNKTLFDGSLPEGSTWDLTFFVMEEDGGGPQKVIKLIRDLLGQIDDVPLVGVLKVALDFLNPIAALFADTDDFIGAFRVRVTRSNGFAVPAWQKLDRVNGMQGNVNGLGKDEYEFIMDGDGSQFPGWYRIIQ